MHRLLPQGRAVPASGRLGLQRLTSDNASCHVGATHGRAVPTPAGDSGIVTCAVVPVPNYGAQHRASRRVQ
jgi:hypothetical protein